MPWGPAVDAHKFQLMPPRKGASSCRHKWLHDGLRISTHAPVRGRRKIFRPTQGGYFLISTHAPVRGRRGSGCAVAAVGISTHAPLRGGRPRASPLWSKSGIYFNSCPRKGASLRLVSFESISFHFNSCPRKGASVTRRQRQRARAYISTHAPVRGRLNCFWNGIRLEIFQLMPP